MGGMNLRLPSGGGLTISFSAADKLIEKGSAEAALLYIYILRRGDVSRAEAANKLSLSADSIDAAVLELAELGLIELPEPVVEKPDPKKSDPGFKMLVGEVQRRLGKVLSSADLATLLSLYSDQNLPAEVISLLVTYCVDEAGVKYKDGRAPTMHQIEKEAFIWMEKGVDTLDSATELLKNADLRRGEIYSIRSQLGITGHTMTVSERKYIESWLELGFGAELIFEAYDRTVISTGKLTWKYMDTILQRWYKEGLMTPDAVQDAAKKRTSAKTAKADKPSDEPVTDEDMAAEIRRMEKLRDIIRGGEDGGI